MKKYILIVFLIVYFSIIKSQDFEKVIWGDTLFPTPMYGVITEGNSLIVCGDDSYVNGSNGLLLKVSSSGEVSHYYHPSIADTASAFRHIIQLSNSNLFVTGIKREVGADTTYPVWISQFDTDLNLLQEKQFYLPDNYVGGVNHGIMDSPDTLLYAFTAYKKDGSIPPTALGLLRIKPNGDTLKTRFYRFPEGKDTDDYLGSIQVFDIDKIPNSDQYIVLAEINNPYEEDYRIIKVNKDLSIDTIIHCTSIDAFGPGQPPERTNLSYWVTDTSFIISSCGFYYGKSDMMQYAIHYDLNGNLLNYVLLNQEEYQDQAPFSYTTAAANDTTIYILGHDMCVGCNEVTGISLLHVYTVDVNLNVLGYNVIENDGYYKSYFPMTNENGDLIAVANKNVGDTYNLNIYLARIPREELGLAVSVKNVSNVEQQNPAYPNPATTIIQFPVEDKYLETGVRISFYTSSGKTALSRPVQGRGNSIEIDLKNLAKGIYIYEITKENKVLSTGKFIKQ